MPPMVLITTAGTGASMAYMQYPVSSCAEVPPVEMLETESGRGLFFLLDFYFKESREWARNKLHSLKFSIMSSFPFTKLL